ncbi:MAG: hypothetical protein HKP36_18375 [Myxococcales bacterium]|nr:hypothetical protein [Deltaproteobacteria bacterium]NNL26399.1 hypothetical protein [Myxococcales bacterium]
MKTRWGLWLTACLVIGASSLASSSASAQCSLTCQAVSPGCNVVTCVGGACFGTAGPDCINGTAGTDLIFGLGGDDCICAEGGGDTVQAGDGNDFVFGGDGADIISGDAGADQLFGEGDNDNVSGGGEADFLFGGAGTDTLNGDAGNDQLFGDVGDDTLNGGPDDDTLFGEAGADTLRGDGGNDTLNGGDDDDQIFGGIGVDTLNGDAGTDILRGEDGNDQLNGGTENDQLFGGNGADSLSGGSGDDILNGEAGNDPQLDGGDGEDTINGGPGNDTANGGAGVDFINGGPDNDTLDGGDGLDIINGNDGDDTLSGGPDNDTLDGGAGTDNLFGNSGEDVCLNAENMDPSCENFTHAMLASFEAFSDQGATILRWVTASESGTVGFHLYREVDGEWEAVHDGLLPGLLDAPQGGVYDFRDPEANASEAERYLLVEVDVRGGRSEHGPFDVRFELAQDTILDEGTPFAREAHELGPIGTTLKAGSEEKQSPGDTVAVYLGIEETGLYTISAAEVAARFGVTEASIRDLIQLGELLLTEEGETVAWKPSADGSALEFFGVERRSIFTTERIYRLSLDAGSTMSERSAAPGALSESLTFESTLHFEEDQIPAIIIAEDPDNDYWFWQLISAEPMMPMTAEVTFAIEAVAGGGTLMVDLQGIEGDAHLVEVTLNGTPLGTTGFEGVVPHQATFSVPEAALREGENTLGIEPVELGSSMLYLNSADLTYTRGYTTTAPALLFGADQDASVEVTGLTGDDLQLFDVSDPSEPVRLSNAVSTATGLQLATDSGRSYFAVGAAELLSPSSIWNDVRSTLQNEENEADYLLITPAELSVEAQALADYREAEGFSTMLVELQDVYDEFAFGTPDPNAIHDFLIYAQSHWARAPAFVVLVGKGSFDYRDILGRGGNLLPPLMVRTQDGIFSSDATYADLVADDGLPDVALGRLPVASSEELRSVIEQIVDYESSLDALLNEVTMLADETLPQDDFGMASDFVSEALPVDWSVNAVYRSELGDLESTRALFFDELRKGPRLVNYLGHAAANALGFREVLLSIDDIEALTVEGAQPLFSNMTCTASRFAVPGQVSLGEALLIDEEAAIAVWGPSGLSINAQATLLSRALVEELSTGGETRIGPMINRALPVLADLEFGREMISIYHLFGDPALRVTKEDASGAGGTGGDGGAAGSAGSNGITDGGGSGCAIGRPRPGASSVPILLLLGIGALVWRRRRRAGRCQKPS